MDSSHPRILAATNNLDKLREIRQIFSGSRWEVVCLRDFSPYPEPEETGETLAANALLKAREGFHRSGLLTLADDTGLMVDALNGAPGVYSSRYAGENVTYADNVNKLLRELEGVPESRRTARFITVMALVGDGIEEHWEGSCEGFITDSPRGFDGFGYDPVFFSPELGMTFALASPGDKNRVSHRGRALQLLRERLRTLV